VEVGFSISGHAGAPPLTETRHVVSLAMLPSEHSALLDGPVSVVLASRNPNGSSHLSPVRLARDEQYLYLAAISSQVVDRNLRARPDVSFLLVDPADPYRWMSVSAHAEPVVHDAEGRYGSGGLINEPGLPTDSDDPTGLVDDERPHGIQTLYRARPDLLMLFDKSRPGQ
jgi:hypothetical protein